MTPLENAEGVSPPAAAISRWRSEPFRLFFPLGVFFAWIGVGHWLLYATGVTTTYSCRFHGLVQMQAFMMAFAIGFLLTALPRRTQSPVVGRMEMGAFAAALITTTGAAIIDWWILAEIAYALLFGLLIQFALRRFLTGEAGNTDRSRRGLSAARADRVPEPFDRHPRGGDRSDFLRDQPLPRCSFLGRFHLRHRYHRRNGAGGAAAHVDARAGSRHAANGQTQRTDPLPAIGGDARIDHRDLHRQDRHTDTEPDDGKARMAGRRYRVLGPKLA